MRNAAHVWINIFLASVCVLLVLVAWLGWQNMRLLRELSTIALVDPASSPTTNLSATDEPETLTIAWHAPVQIGGKIDLRSDPADTEEHYLETFSVGTVVGGTYDGYNFVDLVQTGCAVGCSSSTYRAIEKEGEPTLVVQGTSYLSAIPENGYLSWPDFGSVTLSVPDLDVPAQIVANDVAFDLVPSSRTDGGFMSIGDRKPVAVHDIGTLYAGDGDIRFYMEGKDGKELRYDLHEDWLGSFVYKGMYLSGGDIDVTWEDGVTERQRYELDLAGRNPGMDACRLGEKYVDAIAADSNPTIVPAGTNADGGTVYVLADDQDPILEAIRATPEGKDATQRWVLFWKDPFDRLIRFIRSDWINICGG